MPVTFSGGEPTRGFVVDTCPECAGPVLNVQGLHACRDCSWVGPHR